MGISSVGYGIAPRRTRSGVDRAGYDWRRRGCDSLVRDGRSGSSESYRNVVQSALLGVAVLSQDEVVALVGRVGIARALPE